MVRQWSRRMLATRAAVGLVILSFVVAACGTSTTTTAPTTAPTNAPGVTNAPTADPTSGAVTIENVKMAGAGPVLTLDSSKAGDLVSINIIALSQGNLARHDAAGVPQLELAQSIDFSDDGLTVTVKLHPDQKYSDGSPVTAADIKAIADIQLAGGIGSSFLAAVESVEVVDPLTAVFHNKYPDPDFMHALSMRALALNPADKLASDADYHLHPVSAGPYIVQEYTPNKSIHLVENPNYIKGPMVVKSLDLVSVPDLTSKVLQLATGALDFVWDLPIAAKDSLPPEVKQFTIEVGGANTIYVNMREGQPFANPLVRQAMSLAIDRQKIADIAFAGLVKPLTSFWQPCDDICPENTLPNEGKQDVEAAKALMAQAGVGPEGITAELLVSASRGGWKEGAQLAAADLEAIGIKLTVVPVDEATWNGAVANDNFQAVYNGGASSPQITMNSWFGNGYSATHSGYNLTPGHDKVVALIDQMAQELDVAKRKAIYTEIQLIGRETMPMIPLVNRIALDGIRVPEDVISVANLTPGYVIMQTVAEQAAGMGAGK